MADYYVLATGSDTNAGTSPSLPKKTINSLAGSSPVTPSGSGDRVIVGPGVYRELLSVGYNSSSTNPLQIVADPTGAAFGVSPGPVVWSGWTDDYTPMTAQAVIDTNGKSYVTVSGFKVLGADYTYSCVRVAANSQNWAFNDCIMLPHTTRLAVQVLATAGQALNLTFDRCEIAAGLNLQAIFIQPPLHTAEYNLNVVIRNCTLWGGGSGVIRLQTSGTGSFLGTGVTIQNCTGMFCGNFISAYASNAITPTNPITIYGCRVHYGSGLAAQNTGQITEDGNLLACSSPRSGVNAGANSKTVVAPRFDWNDGRLTKQPLRPFLEPVAGGPLVAFGNYGSTPTVDAWNQNRPATASAGALEIETVSSGGGGGSADLVSLGAADMGYVGDLSVGQKAVHRFTTSASLSAGAATVYRDGTTTKSTAGVSLTVDLDGMTGANVVTVDTSADPTFYLPGHEYSVRLTAGTVSGTSVVGKDVGEFSIRNRAEFIHTAPFSTSGIKGPGG